MIWFCAFGAFSLISISPLISISLSNYPLRFSAFSASSAVNAPASAGSASPVVLTLDAVDRQDLAHAVDRAVGIAQ
jgi:hypothetical protein